MKNLKKSLMIITVLGSMPSLYSSTMSPNGTYSGGPQTQPKMIGGQGGIYHGNTNPVSPKAQPKMIGGQGGIYRGKTNTSPNLILPKTNQTTPKVRITGLTGDTTPRETNYEKKHLNVRITGLKEDTKGVYNPDKAEAILYGNGKIVRYTNIVPMSGTTRTRLPKGEVPFAKIPNPKWTGKSIANGEREYIVLHGIPAQSEESMPTTKLGANGGGIFRGLTIYGFAANQEGLYDRETGMASLNGENYKIVSEYMPLQSGTALPKTIQNAQLIAYQAPEGTTTKKSFGGANTKIYLYGMPTQA